MKTNSSGKLKFLVLSAVFAALTAAATMLHMPSLNGYIHFGDALIYITASCIPSYFAFFAAAVGGALADIISAYAVWAPASFVIKGMLSLLFTFKQEKLLCRRNFIACAAAVFVTVGGYFVAEWIMFDIGAATVAAWGNVIQGVGSAIIYIIIAAALDKMRFKQRLIK